MAHKNPIRNEKICLNCGHEVLDRYCGHCGQENAEPHKTFRHLVFHFFEDLTHYEGTFWKTMKMLMLHPGRLTVAYLEGKRMKYVQPMRLYFFVSFVLFFAMGILPEKHERKKDMKHNAELESKEADSTNGFKVKTNSNTSGNVSFIMENRFKSKAELDSFHKKYPDSLSRLNYWSMKRIFEIHEKYTTEEIHEKFVDSYVHNIAKALFAFMPTFAFLMWLFHNRKRWYYFDHAIFTLHYFSFILFLYFILQLLALPLVYTDNEIIQTAYNIVYGSGILWIIVYFFRAYFVVYRGQKRAIAICKSIVIFIIGAFLLLVGITVLMAFSLLMIH